MNQTCWFERHQPKILSCDFYQKKLYLILKCINFIWLSQTSLPNWFNHTISKLQKVIIIQKFAVANVKSPPSLVKTKFREPCPSQHQMKSTFIFAKVCCFNKLLWTKQHKHRVCRILQINEHYRSKHLTSKLSSQNISLTLASALPSPFSSILYFHGSPYN